MPTYICSQTQRNVIFRLKFTAKLLVIVENDLNCFCCCCYVCLRRKPYQSIFLDKKVFNIDHCSIILSALHPRPGYLLPTTVRLKLIDEVWWEDHFSCERYKTFCRKSRKYSWNNKNKQLLKQQTVLVVMGGDSNSEGHGFESQHWILDGHFTHCLLYKL